MGNQPTQTPLPFAPPPASQDLVFKLLPLSPSYIADNPTVQRFFNSPPSPLATVLQVLGKVYSMKCAGPCLGDRQSACLVPTRTMHTDLWGFKSWHLPPGSKLVVSSRVPRTAGTGDLQDCAPEHTGNKPALFLGPPGQGCS